MNRPLRGIWATVIGGASGAFAFFQLYTAAVGPLPDLRQRAIHLMFGLSLAMLSHSFFKKRAGAGVPVWDLLLVGLILAANLNIFLDYQHIYRFPGESSTHDLILGAALTLLVLESTRRIYGWVIPGMVALTFFYIFALPYMPGMWKSPGLPLEHVMESLYYSGEGIYGTLTGLSATMLAVFIIFGALLMFTGVGDTFVDLAVKIAGRFRGGPAKVAIVASTLFGTVSGSPVANVTVTGNYTIPLMKRLGYRPHFAGAVEAAASTGGMITPPIMGLQAFVMAEILGIPYLKVCFFALIPCFLYYVCVFSSVHFEAIRAGLVGIPKEELPSWRSVLKVSKLACFVIPIVLLIVLLIKGFSITYAGFMACLSTIVLFVFSDFSLRGIRDRFLQLGKALSRGGQALTQIVPLLVSIGMLISLFALSGSTVKFSGVITDAGQAYLLSGLLVAAVVPLVLGMAMPVLGAYVLSAGIVAPALHQLEIDLVAAHMFLVYFSSFAAITPPVCAASYVAANIAETSWPRVGFTAVKLALVGFLVPFLFTFDPALLARGTIGHVFQSALSAGLGSFLLASGLAGYFLARASIFIRLMFITAGALLMFPTTGTDIWGILVAGFGFAGEIIFGKVRHLLRKPQEPTPP